jgi:hypothetical protein
MELNYVVTPLPPVWPGKQTRSRRRAPFKSQWSRTLHILARELRHLRARKVEIALEINADRDLRQDGKLYADARPQPPVILSFLDGDGQRQAYPCDTFGWWQDNLYAIAVVLEDLRRAERYGVQSALIRAGFKALPASTKPALSTEAAAAVLARRENGTRSEEAHRGRILLILGQRAHAREAYQRAAAKTHPDAGGSTDDFQLVQEAKRVLEAHHGGAL